MKRKILSLALAVVLALSLIPTAAFAADSDFVIENGVLVKYIGPDGAVVIPDNVSEIGIGAFSHTGKRVTSVVVGAGVTKISDSAFGYCRYLTSVTLPEGLITIDKNAFETCDKLTSIMLPNSLTTIGFNAFSGTALTNITLPSNLTTIERRAFAGCRSLKDVVFLNPDVEIGSRAFFLTPWLKAMGEFAIFNSTLLQYQGTATNVTVPTGVTKIGGGAFEDNGDLISVTIPSGVAEIGAMAFYRCNNLTRIVIPDSVTAIGASAFFDTGLTSVILPPNLKAIEPHLFNFCGELTHITIPNGVQTIGSEAFGSGRNLSSAIIPASVVEIPDNAFSDCSALTIYGVPGSRAEAYAQRGYVYFPMVLNGSDMLFTRRYQPIPFVDINSPTVPAEINKAKAVSPWALSEIKAADQLGLIVPSCTTYMTGNITRQQFAELTVNLVEVLTGTTITPAPEGTFSDCENTAVLKAYAAGIVNGAGNNTFAPADGLNREQLAAMLYRAWGLVGSPTPSAGLDSYADTGDVSAWAVEGVGSLAAAGIMKGTSSTALMPQNSCSIEQAVLLVYRLYQEVNR